MTWTLEAVLTAHDWCRRTPQEWVRGVEDGTREWLAFPHPTTAYYCHGAVAVTAAGPTWDHVVLGLFGYVPELAEVGV